MSHTEVAFASQFPRPVRRRLSDERRSITQSFKLHDIEGTMTVGLFDDGTPGELWLQISKEGSTLSGLLDTIAVEFSLLLQYGVPLGPLIAKFVNTQFVPSGMTSNPCVPVATSIIDYVFRVIGMMFLSLEELREIGVATKCDECGKAVKCGERTYACTSPLLGKSA